MNEESAPLLKLRIVQVRRKSDQLMKLRIIRPLYVFSGVSNQEEKKNKNVYLFDFFKICTTPFHKALSQYIIKPLDQEIKYVFTDIRCGLKWKFFLSVAAR